MPMKRVYEYSSSSPRPVFVADPTRLILRIDVPERGGIGIGDGTTESTGATPSTTTYESGGTIEFSDGSSKHFSKIEWENDGSGGHSVRTDF